MNDRNENETVEIAESLPSEPTPTPLNDVEFFERMRDMVRTEYLWQWDAEAEDAKTVIKAIQRSLKTSGGFRLVGDIEVEENLFDFRIWLEEPLAFTLGDVDVMLLEALALDLGRGTLFVREMTRTGLVYHILSFGEGRARQLQINVIGPRMQQIRDLGTLTVSAVDTFSA